MAMSIWCKSSAISKGVARRPGRKWSGMRLPMPTLRRIILERPLALGTRLRPRHARHRTFRRLLKLHKIHHHGTVSRIGNGTATRRGCARAIRGREAVIEDAFAISLNREAGETFVAPMFVHESRRNWRAQCRSRRNAGRRRVQGYRAAALERASRATPGRIA